MQESIKFQSVLITGQQSQVGRLQTQPAISPIDPLDNLAYSNSNYFIQKNLPVDYEVERQASYNQQVGSNISTQQMQENKQITAKHSANKSFITNNLNLKENSINKTVSLRKSKLNNDSDSGNEGGIFCGVMTETKPRSMQIDIAAEQTNRSGSDYGVCQIF